MSCCLSSSGLLRPLRLMSVNFTLPELARWPNPWAILKLHHSSGLYRPQPPIALPEAPAGALGDDGVQSLDDRRIPDRPSHGGLVACRPRETHDPASSDARQVVLTDQHRDRAALGGRRHNFRDSTSLIAAFSSAKSAYLRFSRLFSASSSLTCFSSLTDMPAYLLFH